MEWNGIDLRWAYSELLLGLARRTQCVHRAYDVLHDAFIRFILASQRTPIEQPNAYLRRVAHSVLIDQYRDAAHFYPLPDGDIEPWLDTRDDAVFAPSAEHLADMQQRLEAIQRVLDCLPARRREVFWLARIEGHRQVDIARMLGINISMVERHLMRAIWDLHQAQELLAP